GHGAHGAAGRDLRKRYKACGKDRLFLFFRSPGRDLGRRPGGRIDQRGANRRQAESWHQLRFLHSRIAEIVAVCSRLERGAMSMGALDGLTILVPESRELDLFAGMLETQGAHALRCPLVQIVDLEDGTEAQDWIGQMIAAPFDYTVLLTGEGLRRLLTLSGP